MGSRGTIQRGFGLLEAVVALAILAGSGVALFAWIGQNLRDVARIEEVQTRAALQLEALGLLAGVNPLLEPVGERKLGNLQLRWRATEIEPVRSSFPFAGGGGVRWRAGLYRLDVQAIDESSGLRAEFKVEQVGRELLAGVKVSGSDAP